MGVKSFDKANPSTKQLEVYNKFDGGINTELADSILGDNEFREIINFDMDEAGSLKKRPGLYRIPGTVIPDGLQHKLHDLVVERLQFAATRWEIFNGYDDLGGKIKDDLVNLEIRTVVPFFDGIHWVINYITNKGLVVVLLNSDMRLPAEIPNKKPPTQTRPPTWFTYFQLYPYGNGDTSKEYQYMAKISGFNDTWVLAVSSLSATPDDPADSQHPDGVVYKQVQLYNWNPLEQEKVLSPDGTEEDWLPGWREAKESQSEVTSLSTTGVNKQQQVLSDAPFTEIFNEMTQTGYVVTEVTNVDYNIATPYTDYENYDVKVFLHKGAASCWLEIWRRPAKGRVPWNELLHKSTYILRHQTGQYITGNELYRVVYRGFGQFWIYLNPEYSIRYTDQSHFSRPNDYSNKFIKWYYVIIKGSTNEVIEKYPKAFTQLQVNRIKGVDKPNFDDPLEPDIAYREGTTGVEGPLLTREEYESNKWEFEYWDHIAELTDLGVPFKLTLKDIDVPGATVSDNNRYRAIFNDFWSYFRTDTWPGNVMKRNGEATLHSQQATFNYRDKTAQGLVNLSWDYSENIARARAGSGIKDLIVHTTGAPMSMNYTFEDNGSSNNKLGSTLFGASDSRRANAFFITSSRSSNTYRTLTGNMAYATVVGTGRDFEQKASGAAFLDSKYCENGKQAPSGSLLEKNIKKTNFFGHGSSIFTVKYEHGGKSYTEPLAAAYDLRGKSNFKFQTPAPDNLTSLFIDNQIGDLETEVRFFGNKLFSKESVDKLIKDWTQNTLVSVSLRAQWQAKTLINSQKTLLISQVLDEFVDALLDEENKRFYAEGVVTKLPDLNGLVYPRLEYLNVGWISIDPATKQETKRLLFSLNAEIDSEWQAGMLSFENILATLKLRFVYTLLYEGDAAKNISYEELFYTKPSLSDLNNLWYNLVLFKQGEYDRWADIYNTDIYTRISNKLVEYPRGDLKGQVIQLYGLVPVNDVILQPGKQRFQLFYNATNKDAVMNTKVALTAMTIADYTAMINSEDYSTTGYKGEGTKKEAIKGPLWQSWDELFKGSEAFDDDPNFYWENDPENPNEETYWYKDEGGEWQQGIRHFGKRAIFELTIPSTTQPYMVLIQVCQEKTEQHDTGEEDSEGKPITKPVQVPDLATLQETRIQMQPTSSYRTKVNIENLFTEYTSTNQSVNFSTSLIHYGNSNKLFFSDNAVPSYYPVSTIMQMKTPEAIQHCTIFQNKLIVSTTNAKFYVGGSAFDSDTDPYYIREISSDTGLLAPKSEVPLGNYLYFLDSGGIKLLKNLYGTADKEFSFENIDIKISKLVPKGALASNAVGAAFRNKYYINFPEYNIVLVYDTIYKAWVCYEGQDLQFSAMFAHNDKLYAVGLYSFDIFEFNEETYVDNWNEIEDGYMGVRSVDGSISKAQKGNLITCKLLTKNLDQNYIPHQKKYDWALFKANTFKTFPNNEPTHLTEADYGDVNNEPLPILDESEWVNAVIPYVSVDGNLINYKYTSHTDFANRKTWSFTPHTMEGEEEYLWVPDPLYIREDSTLSEYAVVAGDDANYGSRLGENANSYYNIPIQRKGNAISFGLIYKDYSGLILDSIVVRFGLARIKKNRGRQS